MLHTTLISRSHPPLTTTPRPPARRAKDFAQTVAAAVSAPHWYFRMRYLFRHDHVPPALSAVVIGATVALIPVTLPAGALAGAYVAVKR